MTRCTGTSGLIFCGSPPSSAMASRIAARSTTAGTPVKSCISTRAGRYWISRLMRRSFSQSAIAWRSSRVTVCAVLEAQQVLEQHLHREGQARHVAKRSRGLVERIISVALASDLESRAGVEAVLAGRDHCCLSGAVVEYGSRGPLSNLLGAPANEVGERLRPIDNSVAPGCGRALVISLAGCNKSGGPQGRKLTP